MHLPSIVSTASAELIATCGPDAKRAQHLAIAYGAAWSTNDASRVIGSPEIDAILIATPHDTHASLAIAAAHRGKHVFCEKPLGCSMDEARAMTHAVQDAGICHMVGFTWRNIPAAQLAQRMIAAGEIGQVLHVAAHFLRGGWMELPKKRLWQFDRRRAGSAVLANLGVHLFDLLPWMIGQPIVRVCAHLATFGPKPETPGQPPTFDDGHLLLDFAGGAHASVRVSHITTTAFRPPFLDTHQGVEIYGETGALIYDLQAHSCLEVRRPKQPAQKVWAPNPLPNSRDEREVMWEIGCRQIGGFISAIQRGISTEPNFHAGLCAQAIIDAADRSHESNTWIGVDQR